MANDDAAAPPPSDAGSAPQVVANNRQSGSATAPKEPGWYPVRTNPNEQTYWDGNDWTRRRRWSAGTGWTEVSADAVVATAGPGALVPGPRLSANPYAPRPTTTRPTSLPAPGVTLGVLLLALSAVSMMVSSVTTWISTTSSLGSSSASGILGIHTSISATTSGVDAGVSSLIGINGYITLIAAVVVLVFAGLMAVSEDLSVRLIACLFALTSLGLSIYAVVRLVQKINQAHAPHGVSVSLGWGAILLLASAAVATLVTLFEVSQNR